KCPLGRGKKASAFRGGSFSSGTTHPCTPPVEGNHFHPSWCRLGSIQGSWKKRMSTQPNTEKSIRAKFLPYALPFIGEEEINEVVDSLRSGWVTTGPKVTRFEADFGNYVGAKHSIAV